jgi:hypothetical protein
MVRTFLDGGEIDREWILVGTLVAVLVVAVGLSVLVPDAIADRTDPEPDGTLGIEEIAISDSSVGGETVDLSTDVRLAHAGGVTENATVELRAVDLDTGLVAASQRVPLEPIRGDRELSTTDTLTVDRGGDYRVEAIVYRNGQRVATGQREVRGTDALTPEYADSAVTFHRFVRHDLPVVEYAIADAGPNRSTLSVSTHLTNAGASTAEDLELVFTARQVDSGIVADEQSVRIDRIGTGQTVTPETTLTVPNQYNYYLDAVLWEDGVLLETARSGASLDPTETVPVNETERSVQLDVGDFERSDGPAAQTPTPEATDDGDGSGFGVLTALGALVAGLLVLARNRPKTE